MTDPPLEAKDIFLSALERTTAHEREAYLDEACGEDAALKQRVQALIAAAVGPWSGPPLGISQR